MAAAANRLYLEAFRVWNVCLINWIASMAEGGKRRALLFRMTGDEAYANAVDLARTLDAAGFAPVMVPFWPDAHQPAGAAGARALLEGDFAGVERLSAFAFARRFGFVPDLIDLSAHNLAIGDGRIDNLLAESAWNQHMRGTAARAAALMAELRPDAVLVPHGGEVVSRLLAVMAAHLGLPYLYWESPFFPGFHFVDAFAPHFFRGACRIDRVWAAAGPPRDAAALDRAATFMADWRGQRLTKYRQATRPQALADLTAWLGRGTGPVLFLPGQVPFDATIAVSLRGHADLGATYQAALSGLPAPWRVIFKPHPRNPDPTAPVAAPERLFVAGDVSIHDIFPVCQAVAVHSSNVGLEALMMGLPVVAWGAPYYGGKGLTLDLDDAADLGRALAGGVPPAPDAGQVRTLVAHVLDQGLVRQDDGAAMAARLAEASAAPPPARLAWYGAPLRRLAAVGAQLNGALARNLSLRAALATLSQDDCQLLRQRFGRRALARFQRRRTVPLSWPLRLWLARRFSAALGQKVVFDPVNLQAMADPALAVRDLVARAGRRPQLALLPAAGADARALQRLSVAQVQELALAARMDVFGWAPGLVFGWAPGLRDQMAPEGAAVLLVRPAGAVPLSAEVRAWLCGTAR